MHMEHIWIPQKNQKGLNAHVKNARKIIRSK